MTHPFLNFNVEGNSSKPAIVFLHFFGGSLHSWDKLIAGLADRFYCISIDLCGFGNSYTFTNELTVSKSAQGVISLLNHLKIKMYILAGHSMGGKIALYMATRKIPAIKSLLLIAPSPPTPEPGTLKSRQDLIQTHGNPEAIENLILKITRKPLLLADFENILQSHLQVAEKAWNDWIKIGSQENISALMSKITVPVTLISSPEDPIFPSSFLKPIFHKYLPTTIFKEIMGSGHLIPFEATEELAEDIVQEIG